MFRFVIACAQSHGRVCVCALAAVPPRHSALAHITVYCNVWCTAPFCANKLVCSAAMGTVIDVRVRASERASTESDRALYNVLRMLYVHSPAHGNAA